MHRPSRVFRRHRRYGDHRTAQRGFTLVELVISAGLLAFLALVATFFWVDNFRLVLTLNEDSAAIADGRAVLERISREIREVKFDATSGAFCIISPMTATTQIVFNKTSGAYAIGCGGATPTATHNDFAVTIQQPTSSSTINLTYTGTLASTTGVNALTAYSGTTTASALKIVYLDKNSNVTTSTAAVRYVQLTLNLQPPNAPLTKTSTLVALRNN
jgi:prepilin-type N-terminal cleavage/methylation domain-containing protein